MARTKDRMSDSARAASGLGPERDGHERRIPATFTGNELRDKEFPPIRWAVEGILPAGVTCDDGR